MNPLDRLFITGGNFIPICDMRPDYWSDEFQNLDAPRNVPAGSTVSVAYVTGILSISTTWFYIRVARD